MSAEVHSSPESASESPHRDFYHSPTGCVAARLLRERMLELWPDLTGRCVLGLGHATPYLCLWRDRAERALAASPAEAGQQPWPPGHANLSTLVEETGLPFPDFSFDNVLLVHGLETAENGRRLLREVWRVLKEDGRLLVVVPNRRGIWAHSDTTPFGQGRPYSPGQISRLLGRTMFTVERRRSALFIPPFQSHMLLRGAGIWERAGRALAPRFAGVTMVEARKEMFGAVPAGAVSVQGRRVLIPAGMRFASGEKRPAA
ncbi:class I SAM-dependent methyltransferase [Roseomonas marmotae]|uniref:Methyltransferase domain-containing protein n=1 Tax=Roseomonas marmotae TaxID=2768161 RepID=A0ABS3K953_9PROT|nr:methyltransferase domain-containing protein [Roseomonas marmotae]MBO1073996.1 methyltransferase domain-containing protein [Roseomonas marmotae]QTI78784.1 methyltransferase domain-containing protein [Roseomonas marmotae]